MAVCIKGHYGTRDKKDKGARAKESIRQDWAEYSKDLQRGVVHKKPNQIKAIKELHG
ncbi:unnamed protein product, partial [marine sediment metagenome]